MGRTVTWTVPAVLAGERLDVAVGRLAADHPETPALSRTRVKTLIQDGAVLLNDAPARPRDRVQASDRVCVTWPEPVPAAIEPEDIPLDILYEDSDLVVVNKPAGLVVHPAAGHRSGTLVNALAHHCGASLSSIGGVTRPGIVHRLDKGTSGVMVVAKSDHAHRDLASQFAERTVTKTYHALVYGGGDDMEGILTSPLGRHPTRRTKMAGDKHLRDSARARAAVTRWRVRRRWPGFRWLELRPETGRTHQIRVHVAEADWPIVGDTLYGGGPRRMPQAVRRTPLGALLRRFTHPALHATSLCLRHPATGRKFRICRH